MVKEVVSLAIALALLAVMAGAIAYGWRKGSAFAH